MILRVSPILRKARLIWHAINVQAKNAAVRRSATAAAAATTHILEQIFIHMEREIAKSADRSREFN